MLPGTTTATKKRKRLRVSNKLAKLRRKCYKYWVEQVCAQLTPPQYLEWVPEMPSHQSQRWWSGIRRNDLPTSLVWCCVSFQRASWPNNGIMDQRLSRARPPFWAGSSKSSGETRDLQDSIKCTLSRRHYIRKNSKTEFVVSTKRCNCMTLPTWWNGNWQQTFISHLVIRQKNKNWFSGVRVRNAGVARCDFEAGGAHWLAGGALGNCLAPGRCHLAQLCNPGGGFGTPWGMCGTQCSAHPPTSSGLQRV